MIRNMITQKKNYTLLKMRDLSDLNNLYNSQDVVLLLEIIENRFQAMYEKSIYNSRKCNSAGKLILISTSTNNSVTDVFEKKF